MQELAARLQPVSEKLRAFQQPSVSAVAGEAHVAFILMITLVALWPDTNLALCFITGFRTMGLIAVSGVFPMCVPSGLNTPSALLRTAGTYHDKLTAVCRPHPDVEALLEACEKDRGPGGASALLPRQHWDNLYGRNGWRTVPRFPVEQWNGTRACDNGRAGGQNDAQLVQDCLVLNGAMQPVRVVRRIATLAEPEKVDLAAEGHKMQTGGDDLPRAYRKIPVAPEDLMFNIVALAVWVGDSAEWRFQQVFGNLFGYASAVANFSRASLFLQGAPRRLLAIMVSMFFDDASVQDFEAAGSEAQSQLQSSGPSAAGRTTRIGRSP
jgi:hypothetical protein